MQEFYKLSFELLNTSEIMKFTWKLFQLAERIGAVWELRSSKSICYQAIRLQFTIYDPIILRILLILAFKSQDRQKVHESKKMRDISILYTGGRKNPQISTTFSISLNE